MTKTKLLRKLKVGERLQFIDATDMHRTYHVIKVESEPRKVKAFFTGKTEYHVRVSHADNCGNYLPIPLDRITGYASDKVEVL